MKRMNNPKPEFDYRITPEELREFSGFENHSDEEAENAIDLLVALSHLSEELGFHPALDEKEHLLHSLEV